MEVIGLQKMKSVKTDMQKKDKKDFWTSFHCERFPAQLSCVASLWQRHLWVLRSLP
jgi:hypothetical protein